MRRAPPSTYQRRFLITDTAIQWLRTNLGDAGVDHIARPDEDMRNALDEAASAAFEAGNRRPWEHDGKRQVAVDISDYFGTVPLYAIIDDNEYPNQTHDKVIVTVRAQRPRERMTASLGEAIPALRDIRLPPPAALPRPTVLISYQQGGETRYEERLAADGNERIAELLEAGVTASSVRIWQPVKTRLRLEFEI